ncbi:Aldehyde dehydrogenase, dimeric NADP-preferring [Irineochytrium annulatum]|nr:Aldehyde dehydrogenase, dimeric NADP-preferring [Irineochytrium annulatum]
MTVTATPVDEIPKIVAKLRASYRTHKSRSVEWRKAQLRRVHDMCVQKEAAICAALNKDHHRADGNFSYFNEVLVCINECVHALENIDDWVAPEMPPTNPLLNMSDKCEIRHDPLGVVLIIGPWNYPFQLVIAPLISAIAAGNMAIIKPSEVSSHTAQVLTELIPQFLDTTAFAVVNGAVPETTALLKEKFDHIFYTGNGHVGKIVMTAAAKHLTPVVLELGGKSPVYIHNDFDPYIAAKRTFWAKTANNGQTCIAPDYLLVHKKAMPGLVEAFKKVSKEFFGDDVQKSEGYSRIINQNHFKRLDTILERQKALPHSQVVLGGKKDASDLFIEPTFVTGVKLEDPLMEDELFGPLMGLVEVENEEEAIKIINGRDHPLSLYIFANNKAVAEKIVGQTHSGAAVINDYFMNFFVNELPFGGVGPSGMGAYHGRNGFLAYCHRRTTMWRPAGMEAANNVRYPPFSGSAKAKTVFNMVAKRSPPSFLKLFFRKIRVSRYLYFAAVLAVGFFVGRRTATA